MTITETTIEAKKYLVLRKIVPISKVTDKDIYDEAGKKLGAYIAANNLQISGPWSVMYFYWDMEKMETELGIAFPISNFGNGEGGAEGSDNTIITDPELSIFELPEAKASLGVMKGSYDALKDTHMALIEYAQEHGNSQGDLPVMALEEYVVGPMQDPKEENWVTNVYYLHS